MNGFDIQNQKGLRVQDIVKQHLESRGNTVIDVSQDKAYQRKDIDFIVRKDGKETYLEVKMDNKLDITNNLFIECGKQRDQFYTRGWVGYCEAEYICYYDALTHHGLIVDYPVILQLVEKYGKSITYFDKIDDCQGMAQLLPIYLARANNAVVYEFKL